MAMGTKKDAAVSFLQLAASGRVREAYRNHVGVGFRHHNPFFAGDAEALMAGMEENAHVRQKPDDRGAAVIHVFRFEGDRIAELWDVGQPVSAESVNANGMF